MIEIKLSYDPDPEQALENTRFWAPLALTAEQKQRPARPDRDAGGRRGAADRAGRQPVDRGQRPGQRRRGDPAVPGLRLQPPGLPRSRATTSPGSWPPSPSRSCRCCARSAERVGAGSDQPPASGGCARPTWPRWSAWSTNWPSTSGCRPNAGSPPTSCARRCSAPRRPLFGHVAEVAGTVVGCALWFLNYSTWKGSHGIYLLDLYVQPAHRGSGLGRGLLAALAAESRRRGLYRRGMGRCWTGTPRRSASTGRWAPSRTRAGPPTG